MFATSVSSQDGSRRLNCLIEGESIVFVVTVGGDCVISDLKERIQGKRALGPLKGVDPHSLKLWKVDIDLEAAHDEYFFDLLDVGSLQGVKELTSWKSVEEYWSNGLSKTHLHIVVKTY